MNIDILIPNFQDLGAQRVAINVANHLSEYFNVRFVIFENEGPFREYLKGNVKIVDLSQHSISLPKFRVISRVLSYARFTKKNKTNITISFSPITNFFVLYAKHINKDLKAVIQEHGYPSLALKDRQNVSWIFEKVYRYVIKHYYNRADLFVTIAQAIKDDLIKNFNIRGDFFRIIRNPIDIESIESKCNEIIDDFAFEKDKRYIIGVGRLVEQKNFDFLIDIFFELHREYQDIRLIILGQGPFEANLKNKINKLRLQEKVRLLGFKLNPYKYIAKSDIFCLTSKWEGLPQVLAESMICKTLIIAHKCKSGPEEMIEDGVTGYLVEFNNKIEFIDKLRYCLDNFEHTKKIVINAYEYAKNEYSISKTVDSYLKMINDLIQK